MRLREWLVSKRGAAAEGSLCAICMRILGASGLFAIVPSLLLALLLVTLPARYAWLSLMPFLPWLLIYALLVREGARLFRAAEERDTWSGGFTVFQIVFYLVVIAAGWQSVREIDKFWALIGAVTSVCMILVHVPFIVIAGAAGEKSPVTVYVGLLLSMASLVFFVADYFELVPVPSP